MKKDSTRICPKCGNVDLPIKSNFVDMLMPMPEKCGKCGYNGLFPEIEVEQIEEFRKNLKEIQ
jgi:predicted nucleic-acid-binding Zn-ribbon protein